MESLAEDGHLTGEDHCRICNSFLHGESERRRSCTSLLFDPRWTLGQRKRWPDHLCYSDFMQRSIEAWTSRVAGKMTPAIKLWAECYPLPIGVVSARRLYTAREHSYPDELTELLPFRGEEEAYWGLRVIEKRSVLDMFGLKGHADYGGDAGDYLELGSFAYSLRGRDDTCLMRLAKDGAAWWGDFSLKRIQGRPSGSGRWRSPEHLLEGFGAAAQELRSAGDEPTQDNLGFYFDTDGAGIRRWIRQQDLTWEDVQKVL
jgi:hypothetical protein